jgi:glycosyltransferase involved in cell wall biosynthesis
MKPIKIMHTIRQGTVGGGETYLYNLVSGLDKRKYEPVVLSFTEGEMVDKLRSIGIKTHVIKTEKPFSFHLYNKVLNLIKKENIDIVHMHGTRASTNSLIPSNRLGLPSIYTVHGWSFHMGNNSIVTNLRIMAEKFITKNSTYTVCGSEADLETGNKYCGRGNYNLIHNSIDTDKFNPDKIISNFRIENGFDENDIIVSFIGRVTFQKNPETFIKSIPEVVKEIHNAKFIMIGDGELKNECIMLAEKLNVKNRIKFLPFSKNVEHVLKAVDIFVLPSLWEVIPLALLEAMSMQKVCIATNIPGTSEAIVDDENGYLFQQGNSYQLADKITKSILNSHKTYIVKKNARDTVVSKFDIKTLVKKNEELYDSIAE